MAQGTTQNPKTWDRGLRESHNWQVEYLRTSTFHTSQPPEPAEFYWEEVVGASPDQTASRPKEQVTQASGIYHEEELQLSIGPWQGRLEVWNTFSTVCQTLFRISFYRFTGKGIVAFQQRKQDLAFEMSSSNALGLWGCVASSHRLDVDGIRYNALTLAGNRFARF